jgi:hypothetical protein
MKRIYLSAAKVLAVTMSLGFALSISSCKKEGCTDETATNYDEKAKEDDGSCKYASTQDGEVTKTGFITSDETWTSNNIYFLDGKVVVQDGVTLTIEPGTIIKGKQGQEAAASALIIAKGGMIMAEGTADEPIIFTSELDNITYGEKRGTNLTRTDNEKWGGVAILGDAPSSTENGDKVGNLEGIPAEEGYGVYGGDNATDNSGVLKYVSIRHGGISIGEGNELNGLTLAGVGSGTTIDNIEIYATLDDGVEFFGGTVNASNILVYYQGDDGIDIDQNYSGTINGFAVIHGDGIGTDEGLEIDGPEGSTYTDGLFTLINGLCKIEGTEGSAADFKSKAQGTVRNVTFEYGSKAVKLRASFDENCGTKDDAASYVVDDVLVFDNCSMSAIEVYENAETPVCGSETDAAQTAAEGKITTNGDGGSVNLSTWSWGAAGNNNEL